MEKIKIGDKDVRIYESVYDYVEHLNPQINHLSLQDGVNEIVFCNAGGIKTTDDIKDPAISEYAKLHGLVHISCGEIRIGLIDKHEARNGVVYVVGDQNGNWNSVLGWFQFRGDAEIAWADDQIGYILDAIKNWDKEDVSNLQNMIIEYENLCEIINSKPEYRLDYTDLPSEPIPATDEISTAGIWALDRNGYYLSGDTVSNALIHKI